MRISNKLTVFFSVFLNFYTHSVAADPLIFAVDLIRHGDRSPVIAIPAAPHAWPQPLGELTPEGMSQEYQLGKSKAALYIEQTRLLPVTYQSQTMQVRSTDFNRTLMSAAAFLIGLYPPTNGRSAGKFTLPYDYHPIPIHTVSLQEEDLLITKLRRFDTLTAKYVYSQQQYQDKKAQIKNQLAQWQSLTGLDLTNTDNLIYLADNLYIRKIHHISLPPGITPALADEIMRAGEWFSLYKFTPYPVGMSASRELLQTIAKEFTTASTQKSPLKYILYSGHDDTLLSLLSALRLPQMQRPPFASDLNFLLYKNAQGNFYVRVIYNGRPLALPDCGEKCSLAEFSQLTADSKTKLSAVTVRDTATTSRPGN